MSITILKRKRVNLVPLLLGKKGISIATIIVTFQIIVFQMCHHRMFMT